MTQAGGTAASPAFRKAAATAAGVLALAPTWELNTSERAQLAAILTDLREAVDTENPEGLSEAFYRLLPLRDPRPHTELGATPTVARDEPLMERLNDLVHALTMAGKPPAKKEEDEGHGDADR